MNLESLEDRLENWAKVQRAGSPGGRAIGSAEGRYVAANPEPRSIDRLLMDEKDAEEVEHAWGRLLPFDKDILRLHYILRMAPHVICRKVRIPHRPSNTFHMALAHAKSEIARALEQRAEARRVQFERQRAFNARCEICA